jgi:high affinity sulfate transporter 1
MKSLQFYVPIVDWLPNYQRSWLRTDLMAGLAVWAMTVPQALGYAGIANVPAVYGLYTVPLAMIAYAVFGSSRTLSVGPESAIAIISAVTVGALVVEDPDEFLLLTAMLTLIVGILYLLFGLLKLGWMASFLSQPVLSGFTQGIALTVIIGQASKLFGTEAAVSSVIADMRNLPQLLGLDIDHSGFLIQVIAVLKTLGETNATTAVLGAACLLLLFGIRLLLPLAPSALITVVFSVLAVSFLDLAAGGVRVMGPVETGMVSLSLPIIDLELIGRLLPGALTIVLLGYSVSLSVAAVGARETGERIDPNQELISLGVANLGSAVSSGFVVSGSLSRGVVIRNAGGRTQIVSLVNAGLIILTLLFLLPLFFNLPQAALAAIVIAAMSGLLDFGYLRRLLTIDRAEFAYAMIAMFGVLVLGILQGVALGVLLALAVLISRVSRPGVSELGQVPGTDTYRDVAIHSEAAPLPGLLIFRFDAPIIFPNASYFASEIRRRVDQAPSPVTEVLLPAQQINHLDSSGSDLLVALNDELEARGIRLSFAEVKAPLLEMMRRTGLENKLGTDRFHESIATAVDAFRQRRND